MKICAPIVKTAKMKKKVRHEHVDPGVFENCWVYK